MTWRLLYQPSTTIGSIFPNAEESKVGGLPKTPERNQPFPTHDFFNWDIPTHTADGNQG